MNKNLKNLKTFTKFYLVSTKFYQSLLSFTPFGIKSSQIPHACNDLINACHVRKEKQGFKLGIATHIKICSEAPIVTPTAYQTAYQLESRHHLETTRFTVVLVNVMSKTSGAYVDSVALHVEVKSAHASREEFTYNQLCICRTIGECP